MKIKFRNIGQGGGTLIPRQVKDWMQEFSAGKRVFILSCHSLFQEGLKALLQQAPGLEILALEANAETTIDWIRQEKPSVVILNIDDPVPELLPVVLYLLKNHPGIRLIGLSLQDNCICVYQGEEKVVGAVSDLMDTILDQS